jgi:hypothetical protein
MEANEGDYFSPSDVKLDGKADLSLGVNLSKEQLEKIDSEKSCISDLSKTIFDNQIEEDKILLSTYQQSAGNKPDSKRKQKNGKLAIQEPQNSSRYQNTDKAWKLSNILFLKKNNNIEKKEGHDQKLCVDSSDDDRNEKIIEDNKGEVNNEFGQEEIYCTMHYYEEEEEEKSKRLNQDIYSWSTENPVVTDRIGAEVNNSDIYTKWGATIKTLSNSHKGNISINQYQKIVDKYERLMKKMSDVEKQQKDLVGSNKHDTDLVKRNKISFGCSEIEWKEGTPLLDDFLLYLNDNLKFKNAKLDDLPIKYTIKSMKLEIYGIWFDKSLVMEILRHWDQFMQKNPINLSKFNLNCLPNAVLMHPLFEKVKELFFHDFVINIDTMEIEIKEDSRNKEILEKWWMYWNKVLKRKFRLKLFKNENFDLIIDRYEFLKRNMNAFPCEVNCFIIDNLTIIRMKNRYDVNDFSVFRPKVACFLFVIYNLEEKISDKEVFEFISNNIWELEVIPVQKFSFGDTSKMKNFFDKNVPNWVIEVIGMDNKTWPSIIAKIHPLSGTKLDFKNYSEPSNMVNFKKKPLVLTDLEQMKLFTKMAEKTSTDDEPSKIMLSREQIPNFYKNLNVAYSFQIQNVIRKMYSEESRDFQLFSDHYFEFYLEIVEAGELYIVKNEKSQKIISKMLNNWDFKMMNIPEVFNYSPTNGRFYSEGEVMWIKVLNSNINRTYSLINIISQVEFNSRVEVFMLSYPEKEGKGETFYHSEGWKMNHSYIKNAYIDFAKQNIENFELYSLPWLQKDWIMIPEEKIATRREKFKEENPVAGENAKNILNIGRKVDFSSFIINGWINHVIPSVFANMKKEVGGFISTQHKLIDMFELSTLEISYKSFIEYFKNDNIMKSFVYKEDYEKDDIKKTIIIKNWLMIPILGTLKMSDDYKNGWVKEGFELEPYGTFTDPTNEKPYVQIQLDQIRKGECGKEFIGEPCSLADYEKIYELNNWNAYLTFNGVKYFYFVQDKQSSIVIKEISIHIRWGIHDTYKFLFSSNPIDLITIALKFSHQSFIQVYGLWRRIKDIHNPSVFKAVYKQIYIEQDSLEYHLANRDYNNSPQLHFPALIPTYAFFSDTIKEYMETEYEDVLKLVTDRSVEKISVSDGRDEKGIVMSSLLANLKFREEAKNYINKE